MSSARHRFAFIDGLRGIAASGVVTLHVAHLLFKSPAGAIFSETARGFIDWGRYGVSVFFAISGFVIFYAIGTNAVTTGFVWRFVARRSVRLDPPYWLTMLAAVGLEWFALRWVGESFVPPTAGRVVAHVFYVQGILDYQTLSTGLWTLCLEMQFYLFALAASWCIQRWSGRALFTSAFFLALFVPALFVYRGVDGGPGALNPFRSLLPNLIIFGYGVFACFIHERRLGVRPFALLLALSVGALVISFNEEILVGALTGVAIVAASRTGNLDRWLNGRPLQFLGKISYSLYLIHFPVALLVKRVVHAVMGETILSGWTAFVGGLVAALVTATIMHRLLEAPVTRLARSLFALHSSRSTSDVQAQPA